MFLHVCLKLTQMKSFYKKLQELQKRIEHLNETKKSIPKTCYSFFFEKHVGRQDKNICKVGCRNELVHFCRSVGVDRTAWS